MSETIPAVVKDGEITACEQCGAKVKTGSVGIDGTERYYMLGCGSIVRWLKHEEEWEFLHSSECKIAVNSQEIAALKEQVEELRSASIASYPGKR